MLPYVLLGALLCSARAYQLDTVISANMAPPTDCPEGCAVWSDLASSYSTASQSAIDALWRNASVQASVGSQCAIPSSFGTPEGALCYCAGSKARSASNWGYCEPPIVPQPQQVNLQFGRSGAELQVAFVTMERGVTRVTQPQVELCVSGQPCLNVSGSAASYPAPQNASRVYTWNLVPLPKLAPGAVFSYRCIGGTAMAAWSGTFTANALPAGVPQRFALFGDQGMESYSSVGNLLDDQAEGKIDFVVHLGDR